MDYCMFFALCCILINQIIMGTVQYTECDLECCPGFSKTLSCVYWLKDSLAWTCNMGADYLFTWGSKYFLTNLTFCLYKYYLEGFSIILLSLWQMIIGSLKQLASWQSEKPGWCKSAGRPQAPGRWNHIKNVWCTTYFSPLSFNI